MYRWRSYQVVHYGRFNEFLKIWEDLNALMRKRGWAQAGVWTPTVGTGNEAVVEIEFPDLATFQKQTEGFQHDAEVMKVYRGGAGLIHEGTWRDELIELVTRPLA
jgi:antibiotic biosynthesis monooxygenase (ABM) superfamily enzyme